MQRIALLFLMPTIALVLGCNRVRTFTDAAGNRTTITPDGDTAELRVEGKDGSEAQIALGEAGVPVPEDLPEDVPVFTDATVMGTTVAPESIMMVLETTTEPETVMRFYEEQLQANEWEVTDTTRIPQGAFLMANKGDDRNVSVSIGGGDEGRAVITLTIDAPAN
ncbi:MAG: hypothetical protein F6J95_018350 [Leptolyngbya sp. SIO1E4]|nr:hypothetical protein [Leptolyngbya sp. SIO1E4]